jgi:hypothetical protein
MARRGQNLRMNPDDNTHLAQVGRKSRANTAICQFFRHFDRMESKSVRYRRPNARLNCPIPPGRSGQALRDAIAD